MSQEIGSFAISAPGRTSDARPSPATPPTPVIGPHPSRIPLALPLSAPVVVQAPGRRPHHRAATDPLPRDIPPGSARRSGRPDSG
ncbi:hypothetical protein O1L68_35020 [Streptomyces lydicus]|nr:hypothetical protein [Streptomyces lydicus]